MKKLNLIPALSAAIAAVGASGMGLSAAITEGIKLEQSDKKKGYNRLSQKGKRRRARQKASQSFRGGAKS